MDDTLADESGIGIPCLSSLDDVPVHSTPIKGSKVPLPSTRHVIKSLLPKPSGNPDFTQSESLQSIRQSDFQATRRGQDLVRSTDKEQSRKDKHVYRGQAEEYRRQNYDQRNDQYTKSIKEQVDLSNVDNLRPKLRESGHHGDFRQPERSDSPKLGQRYYRNTEKGKLEELASSKSRTSYSDKSEIKHNYCNIKSDEVHISKMSQGHTVEELDNFVNSDSSRRKTSSDRLPSPGDLSSNAFTNYINNSRRTSGRFTEQYSDIKDSVTQSTNPQIFLPQEIKDANSDTLQSSLKVETVTRISGDFSGESTAIDRKKFTIHSPTRKQGAAMSNKSSLSSKNNSFSELENTTLQKQRQEIQLLMTELKDRDRELSDMMTSHQQQLLAWEQDRQRLTTLDKKCTQCEEELRTKSNQLRNAITNLKSLRAKELDNKTELETFRSTLGKLNDENKKYKEELDQLRERVNDDAKIIRNIQVQNSYLQETIQNQSGTVGRLQAREEELTTSLKLKEKDISSATNQMGELSSRLQQLDLRCKECQDREREALKERDSWKQRYEKSQAEMHSVSEQLFGRQQEMTRLTEENRSARQQLALVKKEANMREKCQDELVDSMKIKQERTDSQLKSLRELYERQLREVSALQIHLDTSKDIISKQQNSIEEQQLSGSYNSRGNSRTSEFTPERSSASQRQSHSSRNKSSPSHYSKYREPENDFLGSHHQTQSSGYQSQLLESQTISVAGNHPQLPENLIASVAGTHTNANTYCDYSTGSQLSTHHPHQQQQQAYTTAKQSTNEYVKSFSNLPPKTENSALPKSVHFTENTEHVFKKSCQKEKLDLSENQRRISDEFLKQSKQTDSQKSWNSPDREKCSPSSQNRDYPSVPNDRVLSLNNNTCTPPRHEVRSHFESPPRRDGFIIQQTRIELIPDNSSEVQKQHPVARAESEDRENNCYNRDHEVSQLDNIRQQPPARDDRDCLNELEENYVFENKLRSFLEDIDDIEDIDSLWDERPNMSTNLSLLESSPASKLQKLLLESRMMIQNLEKSSESPRQNTSKSQEECYPDRNNQADVKTTATNRNNQADVKTTATDRNNQADVKTTAAPKSEIH